MIGRKPGSHPGFAYSAGMTAEGGKIPAWDYAHVYEFLKNPQAYIPGTKMSFVGLKKREDRINLIAWLRQQSSSPTAIPAADPKAAAAATAPAGAAGSTPAPNTATTVPSKPGSAAAPQAVNGAAPRQRGKAPRASRPPPARRPLRRKSSAIRAARNPAAPAPSKRLRAPRSRGAAG